MWSPSHIEKLIGVHVLFNKKADGNTNIYYRILTASIFEVFKNFG